MRGRGSLNRGHCFSLKSTVKYRIMGLPDE